MASILWQASVPEAIEDGREALAQGIAVDVTAAGDDAPSGGKHIADDAVAAGEDPRIEDAVARVPDQRGIAPERASSLLSRLVMCVQ